MKKNQISVASLRKGATNEIANVVTNPTYLFRKIDKVAQGKAKDTDLRELGDVDLTNLKALFGRIESTFECGGFWWGSVLAIDGRIATSLRPIKQGVRYAIDENHKVVRYCGGTYYATFAKVWSFKAIIASATACLAIAEGIAAAFVKAEEKAANAESNKADRKARKEEQAKAANLAAKVAELKTKVASGELTEEQAAAALFAA